MLTQSNTITGGKQNITARANWLTRGEAAAGPTAPPLGKPYASSDKAEMLPKAASFFLAEASNPALAASNSAILAMAAAMSSFEHSKAAAPTAGTSAVAATVAAPSFDWILVSHPSPVCLGSSSTEEAEVSILMALICSETPVDTTGALAIS
ncbi:TPA: hypothetical protein ACH3X1_015713 [Trebouxia sp. C0004]